MLTLLLVATTFLTSTMPFYASTSDSTEIETYSEYCEFSLDCATMSEEEISLYANLMFQDVQEGEIIVLKENKIERLSVEISDETNDEVMLLATGGNNNKNF